jgi:eukaryotic-like serine/threonine-protein kinase
MIDRTISHYKILEKLGEGGMGIVYKAHDTKLNRTVALKFLPPAGGEKEKARLILEARAVAQLDHPNICTVYEIGDSDGISYIAMAYIEGETLKDRFENGPLAMNDVIDYARQIARGLQSAHRKHITHRDIKSTNIMVTPDGQIKIMDFGLAKLAGRTQLTQEGSTAGTVMYMSPEQARGEDVDHRTDIWSFGVVLYEMLTGRLPFQSEYETAAVYSILNEDPPPIGNFNPDVPPALEAIVKKALQKNKEDRYQHLDELLSDLDVFSCTAVRGTDWRRVSTGRKPLIYAAAVLLVLLVVAAVFFLGGPVPEVRAIESIAVLPFENLSGDTGHEYFVEGVYDALLTDLARLSGLKRVIARQTMLRYKETDKSINQIARELNVDAVVMGAVVRSGDRVRITVQLINPITEEYLWAERFERDFRDILRLQNDIVQTTAEKIEVNLTPAEKAQFTSVRPVNPEIYELYLRGMHEVNKATTEGIRNGMDYFQQAIEKDPGDARSYAGLALGYITIAHGTDPPPEALSFARAAAERAILLDGNLCEAHAALGFIKGYYDWEWDTAYKLMDQALAINSNLAIAHYHKAWFDVLFSRMDEAVEAHKRAQELDPLTPMHTSWLGEIYRMMGRYEEAIAEANRSIEIAPQNPVGYFVLAKTYSDLGRHDEALGIYNTLAEIRPQWKWTAGMGYVKAGRYDDARMLLTELEQQPVTPWTAWWRSVLHSLLGDNDEAFRWLIYEKPHAWVPWVRVLEWFGPIHQDPRFDDLIHSMNLPPREKADLSAEASVQ